MSRSASSRSRWGGSPLGVLAVLGTALAAPPALGLGFTDFKTTVTWVGQEDALPNWGGCGAAVAKMMAESAEVGGAARTLNQYRTDIERLRVEGPGQAPAGLGMFTDPTALRAVVAANDPGGRQWTASFETDQKRAVGLLKESIKNDRTPAAAGVYRGGHWVTVTGVRTSPPVVANGPEILNGFFLFDPKVQPGLNKDKQFVYQYVQHVTWIASFQTASKYGSAGLSSGRYLGVFDPEAPPADPADFAEPTRPAPGMPIADAEEAKSVAESLVLSEGFSADFAGWTAQFAEEVFISHTTDTGWWVGFGSGPGQISGGLLVDKDQRDLLVAGWDVDDPMSWGERMDFWPYLGDRMPDNALDSDTSGLFQIQPVPEPGAGLLLALGLLGIAAVSRPRPPL